jgi:toxin ParE1/3/4
MEKNTKEVIQSETFKQTRREIYNYGAEAFGEFLADLFFERLKSILLELGYQYDLHSECKHLPTKGKIYRNIIFGKYLVIYRITAERVEILTMLHSSRSVAKIKETRKIQLENLHTFRSPIKNPLYRTVKRVLVFLILSTFNNCHEFENCAAAVRNTLAEAGTVT